MTTNVKIARELRILLDIGLMIGHGGVVTRYISMSKKKLKARIKELEAENLVLRVMALNPVYIYLYAPLPYNPYWQPYVAPVIGPVTCEPDWTWRPEQDTWVSGDTMDWTPPYEIGSGSIGSDPNTNYKVW